MRDIRWGWTRRGLGVRGLGIMVATLVAVLAGGVAPAWALPFNLGDIFIGRTPGIIEHRDSAGNFIENLSIGGSGGFVTGMAFDSAGNLYATGFSQSIVAKFDNQGNPLGNFGSGYSTPESIVFNSAGNVYVGNLGNGIRQYDAAGTFISTSFGGRVDWMDLSADQQTMLYTQEGTAIHRHNVVTNVALSDFATGLGGQAFALRILPDGSVLLANGPTLLHLDSLGNVIQTYDDANVSSWFALNLDPDGVSFLSAETGGNTVCRFNIATAADLGCFDAQGSDVFGLAVFGEITQGCGRNCGGGVPEPATLLLLGSGLIVTIAVRRLARRSASGSRA